MKSREQTIGRYEGKKVEDYYEVVKNKSEDESAGVDAEVFEYLKKILPKDLKGKTVLDIGCGDARWSEYLHKLGAEKIICGLDISQDMISLANQRKKQQDLKRLGLVRADMRSMPITGNSIDIALSTFSLMYFKDLEEIMQETSRVLKKDGELYIATNIITINDADLAERLKGKSIPIDLGCGDKKIHLENLVQPIEQYKSAFQAAELVLKDEKYFAPEGVAITPDYKYYDKINLKKAVFKLQKMENKKANQRYI